MKNTTLCYIENNDNILMLHRTKKENDVNEGKWIGVGGHFESGETPDACVMREVWEETGFILRQKRFRGVVDFIPDRYESERMYLYTSDDYAGEIHTCDEGDLAWIPVDQVKNLNLWEGDRIFLEFLLDDAPFFHLQLRYEGDRLVSHRLMPHVVLASQSPRRKDLLEQIGIFADIVPSEVTEFTLETEPAAVVEDLSSQKANGTLLNVLKSDKYDSIDELIVIAADTVVVNNGQVLGKPSSHDDAFQMIKALQGKTHQVYTGVTLVFLERADGKFAVRKKKIFSEETDVTVSAMTDEEIRDYADSDEPMDKAGSYGIQGTFARFIERINGDYNNVVGLPVSRVHRELRHLYEVR